MGPVIYRVTWVLLRSELARHTSVAAETGLGADRRQPGYSVTAGAGAASAEGSAPAGPARGAAADGAGPGTTPAGAAPAGWRTAPGTNLCSKRV